MDSDYNANLEVYSHFSVVPIIRYLLKEQGAETHVDTPKTITDKKQKETYQNVKLNAVYELERGKVKIKKVFPMKESVPEIWKVEISEDVPNRIKKDLSEIVKSIEKEQEFKNIKN